MSSDKAILFNFGGINTGGMASQWGGVKALATKPYNLSSSAGLYLHTHAAVHTPSPHRIEVIKEVGS